MKILLDECLPHDFRHCLQGHEVHTVEWAGWKSKKNGELIKAADSGGYQVLLTVDQGILYQQDIATRRIAIIVIRSKTNQLEDLVPLAQMILEAFERVTPGQVLTIVSEDLSQ